jgi:cell division protein FtsW
VSRLDKGILLTLFGLLGIGLVQVYSSSFIFAIESRGDGLFFFKRQMLFTVIALVVLFTVAAIPYRWIERYGFLLWGVATLGIFATYLPGIGASKGGAARWIVGPGGFIFEPCELVKISFPILLATFASRRWSFFGNWEWFFRVVVVVAPLLLVLRQPDFGTFFICSLVLLSILFVFGLPWKVISFSLAAALPAFYFLVMNVPYRRARILAFLDPWADPGQKGFQVIQSMLSFRSGGLFGVGLGQGQGKLFFLPEAHTDFTLAVLGEEIGFVGFAIVIGLYGYLVLRGLQLASRSENPFSKALSLGLILTFGYSVFINVGVVLGLLPTKGLTLPFLSYGGSSLIMSCLLFGFILNIERHERKTVPTPKKVARLFRQANGDYR